MQIVSKSWFAILVASMSLLGASTLVRADNGKKAAAKETCPTGVKSAIDSAFPKATITRCKAENEHGHAQFEVNLTKADGADAEVDVSPEGKILQVEEKIAIDKLPSAVMKGFAAKYPKAKADGAEKQTPNEGKPTYEIAFQADNGRKEATFTEDGKFVEEE